MSRILLVDLVAEWATVVVEICHHGMTCPVEIDLPTRSEVGSTMLLEGENRHAMIATRATCHLVLTQGMIEGATADRTHRLLMTADMIVGGMTEDMIGRMMPAMTMTGTLPLTTQVGMLMIVDMGIRGVTPHPRSRVMAAAIKSRTEMVEAMGIAQRHAVLAAAPDTGMMIDVAIVDAARLRTVHERLVTTRQTLVTTEIRTVMERTQRVHRRIDTANTMLGTLHTGTTALPMRSLTAAVLLAAVTAKHQAMHPGIMVADKPCVYNWEHFNLHALQFTQCMIMQCDVRARCNCRRCL